MNVPEPAGGNTDAARSAALRLLDEMSGRSPELISQLRLPAGTPDSDWAASGAMALSGRKAGPPMLAPGAPASVVRGALAVLAAASGVSAASLPDIRLLGERAALAGYPRRGPRSVGGGYEIMPTADGWVGVSLARPADGQLVAALISQDVTSDGWTALRQWLSRISAREATQRLSLLGMAGGAVPLSPRAATRAGVRVLSDGPRRIARRPGPKVVDLSALWAGPLCAHLLGLAGAEVVKVESTTRPDGARFGTKPFFDLLHGSHAMVALDFGDPSELATLRELLTSADVVIESSRPRALQQLGIRAEDFVGQGIIWVSVTAYGREQGLRVGFGDDVAGCAGLVAHDERGPLPIGDALADPLAGVWAAGAAALALRAGRSGLLDVSMAAVASFAASLPNAGAHDFDVEVGHAALPFAREPACAAGELGADTDMILRALASASSSS